MTLSDVDNFFIKPAFLMLPEKMVSVEAKAMLLSIGLQESRFKHRKQINGPARGFWQFEVNGVRGILTHPQTRQTINKVLHRLQYYNNESLTIHPVLEHNDILAAVFARLNLWWLPQSLPGPNEVDLAWNQYIESWRPGKPHPETWEEFYTKSWEYV